MDTTDELELRDLYYSSDGGYMSLDKLWRKVKADGLGITKKQVAEWLAAQGTYQKFKPAVRTRKYSKTMVSYLGEQVQLDLVDMKKYAWHNKGYYWILTGIEILSRYGFGIPVKRKDIKNMTAAVTTLLSQFPNRFGYNPRLVQFDNGKEFYNVGVKTLLSNNDISYFSTSLGSKHAALVERYNRTLKTRMWKYFGDKNTKVWIDVLDQFVDGTTRHFTEPLE